MRFISSAVTMLVMSIRHLAEGKPEPRDRSTFDADCPECGRTTVNRSRQTACCANLQWIPSGNVASRAVKGWAGNRRPTERTIRETQSDYLDQVPLGLFRINQHIQ